MPSPSKRKQLKNKQSSTPTVSNKHIVLLFFVVVVVVILVIVYNNISKFSKNNLQVENINILGASKRVHSSLYDRLQPLIGEKMGSVNLQSIKNNILHTPWLQDASLSLSYPNSINIKVIERNPLLVWENDSGEFYIVNSEDKVIRKAKVEDYKKYILIKKGEFVLKNSDYIRFIIYKHPKFMNRVSSISLDEYWWDIYLKNGVLVKLPEKNTDRAIYKVMRAQKKYNILDRDIEYIDARIVNKLFIMPNSDNKNKKQSSDNNYLYDMNNE